MSESSICPSCNTALVDSSSCPECDPPVADASPFAPPRTLEMSTDEPEVEPLALNEASTGQKIAAAAFIAIAIVNVLSFAMLPISGSVAFSIVPGIIDVAIAISILRGSNRYVGFAIFRVVIGVLVWSARSAAEQDLWSVGAQLALSGALLMLLVGNAGRARRWTAVAILAPVFLVMLFAIGLGPGGLYRGEVHAIERRTVAGGGFVLTVPNDTWHQFDRAIVAQRNPDATAWIVEPWSDAHVQVIEEPLVPEHQLDIAGYERNVLRGLEMAGSTFEVREREVLDDGVFLVTALTIDGQALEYRHRLYVDEERAIQVIAFAPDGTLHPEAVAIVRGARLGAR